MEQQKRKIEPLVVMGCIGIDMGISFLVGTITFAMMHDVMLSLEMFFGFALLIAGILCMLIYAGTH